MADVFDKCRSWQSTYRTVIDAGVYAYYRPLSERLDDGEAVIDGRRVLAMGSNDYLGLSTDPRVQAAAAAALQRFGSSCSGSRMLNGTLALHNELEARLAAFLHRESVLVATTGFQANLAIAALLSKDDVIFGDACNHASLIDGVRLGFATYRKYRHGDIGHLERLLTAQSPDVGTVIITDGVFSMDGDVCPLPGIVALAQRHGARVVVDSAHDIGLLGEHGRGVAEHFGLEDHVDLLTGTLSKCFGSLGGILAGPLEVIDYLRHRARSIMYAAAMSPAAAAAALTALDIVESEPWRRHRVLELAGRLRDGLGALGFDTGSSVTPVVPVYVGESMSCLRFWQELFDAGVFVNAVIPPGVPEGRALLRVTPQAIHTEGQLARTINAFALVGRRMGITAAEPPHTLQPTEVR